MSARRQEANPNRKRIVRTDEGRKANSTNFVFEPHSPPFLNPRPFNIIKYLMLQDKRILKNSDHIRAEMKSRIIVNLGLKL